METKTGRVIQAINNSNIENFFHQELKDIYGAEKNLIEILPKIQENCSVREFQRTFADYLNVKKTYIARLGKMFEIMRTKPQIKNNILFNL